MTGTDEVWVDDFVFEIVTKVSTNPLIKDYRSVGSM